MKILSTPLPAGVISLAAGLPAAELFPLEDIRQATLRVFANDGCAALQYGGSYGVLPLREKVVEEMAKRGVESSVPETIITTGSQQALDLVARAFLDQGDVVLTENPTYLAALQVFETCEAELHPIPTDEHGLITDALPELIERYHPKLLYTVSNFQNPTGITLSLERRKALADIASRTGLIVIEDDPYGQLRYRGAGLPPVKSFDTTGNVIYNGTYSKTVAPGLRVGWVTARAEIVERLVVLKQATDLHSSSLDQRILLEYIREADVAKQIGLLREVYGRRCDAMDEALEQCLADRFTWNKPEGGMFFWLSGPSDWDVSAALTRGLQHGVVFVPGGDFYPAVKSTGEGKNQTRLNFTNIDEKGIKTAVTRISEVA